MLSMLYVIWSNYNSYAISTCCDKSDGLPHDELRAVSSDQIAMLNRVILSRRQLKEKEKRDGSR